MIGLVVVTGAAQGIGQAVACRLARDGYSVAEQRFEEGGRNLLSAPFVGRAGSPDEVASMCAYLLGEGSYIIGQSSASTGAGRRTAFPERATP